MPLMALPHIVNCSFVAPGFTPSLVEVRIWLSRKNKSMVTTTFSILVLLDTYDASFHLIRVDGHASADASESYTPKFKCIGIKDSDSILQIGK